MLSMGAHFKLASLDLCLEGLLEVFIEVFLPTKGLGVAPILLEPPSRLLLNMAAHSLFFSYLNN